MLLSLWLSCTSAPAPAGILLITVDGMRSDALHPEFAPQAWALGERGRVYRNAWTPVGDCLPATEALFVQEQPLADALEQAGWRTGAVVGSAELSSLALGFEHWDAPATGERAATESVALAQTWIRAQSGPWLLWVHLSEPLAPHTPSGAFLRPDATGKALYRGEVSEADAALAPLLSLAEQSGSHVLLSADHGQVLEEEACSFQHAHSSSPMVMRVPLIASGPTVQSGVSDDMVGTPDLYDTVLSWAGVPAKTQGVLERRGRSHWVGRSGGCDPSCSPGCAPAGPEGADRVVYGENGGMYRYRPGAGGFGDAMLAGALE